MKKTVNNEYFWGRLKMDKFTSEQIVRKHMETQGFREINSRIYGKKILGGKYQVLCRCVDCGIPQKQPQTMTLKPNMKLDFKCEACDHTNFRTIKGNKTIIMKEVIE